LSAVDYSFVTNWKIRAPLKHVWEAIFDSDRWPVWWKGVEQVVRLEPATGPHEVGSLRRYTWKSRLPYRLTFTMRMIRVEPLLSIEAQAVGELEGTGRWSFSEDRPVTTVRYDWNVRTTQPWMSLLASVGRPLFVWNHNEVMRQGGEGLAEYVRKKMENALGHGEPQ